MEEKLLDEMNEVLSVSSEPDEDDLPFEPLDAFSTDPVEFSEMAERMLVKVENIFDLTRIYNRHSPKYLKAFSMLERGIRQLGSVCVTRSALKVQNCPLPELGQLTTQKLYGMASFNYRKLDAALSEKLKISNDLYPELTDAFFRCFTLLRRLRATERKIYTYFDRQYFGPKDFKPAVEGFAFSDKSWTKSYYPKNEEAPAFRDAPAYPVIRNSEFGIQKSESRNQDSGIRIQNSEKAAEKAVRSSGSEADKFGIRNLEFGKKTDPQSVRSSDPVTEKKTEQTEGPASETNTDSLRETKKQRSEDGPIAEKKTEQTEGPANETDTGSGSKMKNQRPDLPYGVGGPTPGGESLSCTEIVRRAVMRGPATEKGGIVFKNSEVLALADDPLLEHFFPDMAPWVKRTAVRIRGTDSLR